MNKINILLLKELKCIFVSPMCYVVGAIFSFLNGYSFWILVNLMHGPVGETADNIITVFFGGTLFFWIALFLIIPLITMRSLSEEKKSNTIDLLFSLQITDLEIILSKFLSVLIFYLILWLPTVFYILFVSLHGVIDVKLVLASYVGIIFLGSLMISLGILFSALTKNQVIAAILTFFILILMFSVGFLKSFMGVPFVIKCLEQVCVMNHMENFTKGIMDLRIIIYYISFTIVNLFLGAFMLRVRN